MRRVNPLETFHIRADKVSDNRYALSNAQWSSALLCQRYCVCRRPLTVVEVRGGVPNVDYLGLSMLTLGTREGVWLLCSVHGICPFDVAMMEPVGDTE